MMEMEVEEEKVYVVVGNDVEEGVLILDWVMKRWASHHHHHHPISIVILYANSGSSIDFVSTPFGKLPASAVRDDKLEILRRCEQQKIDKLLSKYLAFCGKVKAEVENIEKKGEPIQKVIVEMIMERRITKMVLAISVMRSSSFGRTTKSGINGCFYVHRSKPDFCTLYILCGGKLVAVKDDQQQNTHHHHHHDHHHHDGDHVAKHVMKLHKPPSLKGWLGRVLSNYSFAPARLTPSTSSPSCPWSLDKSPSSNVSPWDNFAPHIDDYYHQLLLEYNEPKEEENGGDCATDQPHVLDSTKNPAERIEALKSKTEETQKMSQLKKQEAKSEVDRQSKTTWALSLCNHRAEELESHISEEISMRLDLTKELENTKEQITELIADIEESKNRLTSLSDLQSELSTKLQISAAARSREEARLESSAAARAEVVREIEELRKQRDVLQRRIEFCKEKDAIGMANCRTTAEVSCSGGGGGGGGGREYSAAEIRVATEEFAAERRMKADGEEWSSVYKGRINQTAVAVKVLDSDVELSEEIFHAKVNLLMNVRHPNITAPIGYCTDLKCFVFEYLPSGCLRDTLFSRRKSRSLPWRHRIHIAADVSSALGFLHLAHPRPIIHSSLNPSTILLDRHFVAKINAFHITPCYDDVDLLADVVAFGVFILQLLLGRNWAGLDQEELMMERRAVIEALDENAGEWPMELAEEMVEVGMKCMRVYMEEPDEVMAAVSQELSALRKKADELVAKSEYASVNDNGTYTHVDSCNVPTTFVCPIFQEVMESPHMAADGYSYELEAIEEWVQMGHDTSPVTGLKLAHMRLLPNHTLRSLIQDWRQSLSPS